MGLGGRAAKAALLRRPLLPWRLLPLPAVLVLVAAVMLQRQLFGEQRPVLGGLLKLPAACCWDAECRLRATACAGVPHLVHDPA